MSERRGLAELVPIAIGVTQASYLYVLDTYDIKRADLVATVGEKKRLNRLTF